MSEAIRVIERNVDQFNQSIRDTMKQKGINDSGSASRSLRVVTHGNRVQSRGSDYLIFLDKGRRPGKFPPVDKIRAWVRRKLGIDSRSIAFLIGRKIAREGTNIYKNPSKGIEIDKKIDELRMNITNNLGKSLKTDITRRLKK